ncbi:hypothetical protein, partial [Alistipes finegoldii]|uniref:hypothetical protein n=1 Tax=Alistipes finegoldii TaxID=214856 RepID=UPI003FD89E4C
IQLAERKNKYSKSFKVPLFLRTANSYDGKGSRRIFIPYFQLLIQINNKLIFLLIITLLLNCHKYKSPPFRFPFFRTGLFGVKYRRSEYRRRKRFGFLLVK